MKRRNGKPQRVLTETKSALAIALEQGKNVKGMTGYISLSDSGYDRDDAELFVKVKCLGIDTGDGCGLKIKVQVIAGAGELTITPCRWLDTIGDVSTHRDLLKRQAQAKEEYDAIYSRPHYHRDKATFLANYIEQHLTANERGDWDNHVASVASKYTKQPKRLDQFSQGELQGLAKVAVCVVNKLDATQVPDRFH